MHALNDIPDLICQISFPFLDNYHASPKDTQKNFVNQIAACKYLPINPQNPFPTSSVYQRDQNKVNKSRRARDNDKTPRRFFSELNSLTSPKPRYNAAAGSTQSDARRPARAHCLTSLALPRSRFRNTQVVPSASPSSAHVRQIPDQSSGGPDR